MHRHIPQALGKVGTFHVAKTFASFIFFASHYQIDRPRVPPTGSRFKAMVSTVLKNALLRHAPKQTLRLKSLVRFITTDPPPSSPPASSSSPLQPDLGLDNLPRYPLPNTLGVLRLLDYVGTISFAYSGTLLAASSGMDLLGAAMVGTVTAIGGGTIRDSVILCKRPFWTEEVEYLYIALLTAAGTFVYFHTSPPEVTKSESASEFFLDALGVGAFCVIGAANGVRARVPNFVCGLCGMATATFGGVVRDVLCDRQVRILHSTAEIYASTAAAGAATYLVARRAKLPAFPRVTGGVGVAVALRSWAWSSGIRLPVWPKAMLPTTPDTTDSRNKH